MKKILILLALILIFVTCAVNTVNIPINIKPAYRSNYGYTPDDPIRIGLTKDYYNKNLGLCYSFIANLRTSDMQTFSIIKRVSMKDPNNNPEAATGFLGLPQRNAIPRGGILDRYTLVSEQDTDTIQLYFDIYHKDTLMIPNGLIYNSE